MSEKISVIGAGMAGLLAGAMLRSDCDGIYESQKSLPNNHSALLRFRSSVVGDTLGIEFKKVPVLKSSVSWRNPVADALAYAAKCTGEYTLRSSLTAKSEIETRYIAPTNLIQQMADRVQAPIHFGQQFEWKNDSSIFISTMPMPSLMKLLEWSDVPEFRYVHGCNINATLQTVDAYCSLYVADPDIDFGRISITGNRLTIEFPRCSVGLVAKNIDKHLADAFRLLGMSPCHPDELDDLKLTEQKYAKILPIDEAVRQRFMIWATDKHRIYSLGRFATWRPGLLMDDVVNDVRVIQRLIRNGHSYEHRKA